MKIFKLSLILTLLSVYVIAILANYNQERVQKLKMEEITKIIKQTEDKKAISTPTSTPTEPKTAHSVELKTKVVVSTTTVKNTVKYEDIITKVFGEKEANIAIAVMMAESQGNPKATGYNCFYKRINGELVVYTERVKGAIGKACRFQDRKFAFSKDQGLMQINDIHGHDYYDVHTNILKAKEIRDKAGWQAWSSYNSGKYLAYL